MSFTQKYMYVFTIVVFIANFRQSPDAHYTLMPLTTPFMPLTDPLMPLTDPLMPLTDPFMPLIDPLMPLTDPR